MDDSFNSYISVYFTQLFHTLGTVSAVLFSGSFAIPMFSYYVHRQFKSMVQDEMNALHNRLDVLEEQFSDKKYEKLSSEDDETYENEKSD